MSETWSSNADGVDYGLAEKIVEFVSQYGDRSFVEMEKEFPDDFNWVDDDGKSNWMRYDTPNLYLWIGASDRMINTLWWVVKEGKVHYEPASLLVYLVDGKSLNLPIAKRPPKNGYKDPHWLPVSICSGPHDE